MPPSKRKSEGDGRFRVRSHPLREWPPTDKVTVLMEAVLVNSVKTIASMLREPRIIWNQRGPCGRKPEQAALELGHFDAHAMLVSKREAAELMASALAPLGNGPVRL